MRSVAERGVAVMESKRLEGEVLTSSPVSARIDPQSRLRQISPSRSIGWASEQPPVVRLRLLVVAEILPENLRPPDQRQLRKLPSGN